MSTSSVGDGPGFVFSDVTAQSGLLPVSMPKIGMGGGVAAADYNNNGLIDLFVPNRRNVRSQLYRNNGDGTFTEISAEVGLNIFWNARAALWIDYDGDHLLDLLVLMDCFDLHSDADCAEGTMIRLYRQGEDGMFEDVTIQAGLWKRFWPESQINAAHIGGVCAGDVTGNGYLDIFIGIWGGDATSAGTVFGHLLRNNGNGTFTEISGSSGVRGPGRSHWQPVMYDFTGNGYLDIFVAVDFLDNHFWINQGNQTFINAAHACGVALGPFDMGVALGDYDNDGDMDIFVSNIYFEGGKADDTWRHYLYRNDSESGSLSFTDVGREAGVHHGDFGWGSTFFDANNNGWLDLAVTNGFALKVFNHDRSRFYLNMGPDEHGEVTFKEVSDEVNFHEPHWGSALLSFDYNRDGWLDMIEMVVPHGPARLLENQPIGDTALNRHLVIKPRMRGPNHRAIGAVVRARAGDLTMMRPITAGTSFFGQEPAEAFFGVALHEIVDEVIIEWPGGAKTTTLRNVPTNQVLTVYDDGLPADLNGDGVVNAQDLGLLLGSWGPCPAPRSACIADLTGDGSVGAADLAALFANWGVRTE